MRGRYECKNLTANNIAEPGRPSGKTANVEILIGDDLDAFLSLSGKEIRCHLATDGNNGNKPNLLILGHLWTIKVLGYQPNFGNSAWNAFDVSWEDAIKVINYLMRRKWHCESGFSPAKDDFEKQSPITESLFYAWLI